MAKVPQSTFLSLAILVAAVSVSSSFVYFGMQAGEVDPDDLKIQVREVIEEYVQEKEEEYKEAVEEAQAQANKPQFVEGDVSGNGASFGDEGAPVTIVEFSDFQCPYCSRFYEDAYQEIKKQYVETGKVKFVYRHFPLGFHEAAYPAALATECVREQGEDEMFFDMHDKLYENQDILAVDKDSLKDSLVLMAQEIGADKSEFTDCYDSDKYQDQILKDYQDGQAAGITGTPGFVINGQILKGAQPFSNFEPVIESALSEDS